MIPYRARAAAKRAVTETIGRVLASSGSTAPFASLCYHSVSSNPSYLSVEPASLQQHLEALREWGFRFVTMGQIAAEISAGSSLLRPTVALTFDDGYKDGVTTALPILLAAGARATFYVTSGLTACSPQTVSAFRALTHYDAEYLTPSDLCELRDGAMEVGAHTVTHPNLARLSPVAARRELRESKDWLEQILSVPVDQFAYPFGKRGLHYTRATLEIVKECGYQGAASAECLSVSSLDSLDRYQIPRFFVTREDSVESLKQKVFGAFNWLGWVQAHSPCWLKAAISPEDARV